MYIIVKRFLCMSIALYSFAAWHPTIGMAANPGLFPITHTVASSFTKNGENYYPNGNLLFTASKRVNPTIETLDEFLAVPSVKGKFLIISLYYISEKGSVVATREPHKLEFVSQNPYFHITTTWRIANKPLGKYLIMLAVDGEEIANYVIEIIE